MNSPDPTLDKPVISTGMMTLWTPPRAGNPYYREEVFLMALSWVINRKTFPHMTLVADGESIELCEKMGFKFDVVRSWLDNLTQKWARVWSFGKMEAYRRMASEGHTFCSIDWDAMIRKPIPERLAKAQIFAQYEESNEGRNRNRAPAYNILPLRKLRARPRIVARAVKAGCRRAFNSGFFGGQNLPWIADTYQRSMDMICDKRNIAAWDQLHGTTIVLLMEQWWPLQRVLAEGRKVEYLISDNETEEEAADVGFTHFIGNSKYSRRWCDRIEAHLRLNYPELHERVCELFVPNPTPESAPFLR